MNLNLAASTIIALAVGATFIAIVVVAHLVATYRRLNTVVDEIRGWKNPDRGEIGRRMAETQRPLPEIIEVSRPVETSRRVAPPALIIWGGTVPEAERVRRLLNLPAGTITSDGSVRSIEGRRVHVVLVVGTAGQSPDGERMRQVLVHSGMKTSPGGAVFIDLRRLDA